MRESILNIAKGLCAIALVAFVLLGAACLNNRAWAQEQENTDGDDKISPTTREPNNRDAEGQKVSKEAGKLQAIPPKKESLTHLPPMLAVRGLSDSEQIKKVLRSMITSQIPVMYQTMMMVENGAATGFMGSMETVPGLLDNATNSAQLELTLKEITDSTGAEALGYVNSIHEGMKKQSPDKGKNLWPVGIFYASGDSLDDTPLTDASGYKIKQEPSRHQYGGSTKLDAISNTSGADGDVQPMSGFGAGIRAMADSPGPAPGGGSSEKLSEILWQSSQNSKSQDFGTDLEFQTKIVGDLTVDKGDAKKDQPFSSSEIKYVEPTESVDDVNASSNANSGSGNDGKLRGFYYLRYEKKKKLWEETYKLMGKYCKFKSDNKNRGKKLFQKLTPASEFTPEMLKQTSSRSFKWTVNLLDIFFKTWMETRSSDPSMPNKIDCDFDGNESADRSMPIKFETPDNKFDNCKAEPKKCSRNRWILKLVELIAEDRVIDDFKNWHEAALNRALGQHPWVAMKVEELLCTSLRAERTGGNIALCDTTLFLEKIAENNRQSWVRIVGDLSKMAQNAVGSASFRPQQNSVHNSAGGATQTTGTNN
jgi:hypothetical protein